ncbi:MAG: cation transporter [Armatimonadetes bacterium]|nr:cation transporter [Armatimonadota bacterium]
MSDRTSLLRQGMRLETVTVLCTLAIAACTVSTGLLTGSTLLLAVGAGSAADLLGSLLLYRPLRLEVDGGSEGEYRRLKHQTARTMGFILALTAVYVLAISVYKYASRLAPTASYLGIGMSLLAAVSMPFLAASKMRLAGKLDSRSLNAEAVGTLVGGLMAAVALIGLVGDALLRWWWIDSVVAMLLVQLLLREAFDAWRGQAPSG